MCRFCGDIRCLGCGPAEMMRREYYYWRSIDRDDKANEIESKFESTFNCGINGDSLSAVEARRKVIRDHIQMQESIKDILHKKLYGSSSDDD